jgi:putative transcriptional regulator
MALGTPSHDPIENQIRRLRFEHGEMTQQQLADALGITRQTVIALEGLRYAPSLDLAMRIAEVFGKRIDEVFYRRRSG